MKLGSRSQQRHGSARYEIQIKLPMPEDFEECVKPIYISRKQGYMLFKLLNQSAFPLLQLRVLVGEDYY